MEMNRTMTAGPSYTEAIEQRNAARDDCVRLRAALRRLHAASVGYHRSASDELFEELQTAMSEARAALESR